MIVAWDWREDLFIISDFLFCCSAGEGTMKEEDRWCLGW